MPGLRELGLAGAALTLTGAVAYVVWSLRDTEKRRKAEKVTLTQDLNAEKEEKLETRSKESAREVANVTQVCLMTQLRYFSYICIIYI